MRTRFIAPWVLPAITAAFALAFYWLLPDTPEGLFSPNSPSKPLLAPNTESAEGQRTYTDPSWLHDLVDGREVSASDLPYRNWLLAVVESEHPDDRLLTAVLLSGYPQLHIPLLGQLIAEGLNLKLTLTMAERTCQSSHTLPLCETDPMQDLLRLDPENAMPLDRLADRAFIAGDLEVMREIVEQATRLERIDSYELEVTRLLSRSKARHGIAPALGDLRAFARIRASAGFAYAPSTLHTCLDAPSDGEWRETCVRCGLLRMHGGTSQLARSIGWVLLEHAGETVEAAPDSTSTLSNRPELWGSAHEIPLTVQQWRDYLHRWEAHGELEAEVQLMAELDSAPGDS